MWYAIAGLVAFLILFQVIRNVGWHRRAPSRIAIGAILLAIGVGLMVIARMFRYGIPVALLGTILVLTGLKSRPERDFPKLGAGQLPCPRCGMDNNEGSDYCDRCGTSLV